MTTTLPPAPAGYVYNAAGTLVPVAEYGAQFVTSGPATPGAPGFQVVTDQKVMLGELIMRGSALRLELQEAITDASVSWGTDAVTEVSFTVQDPGFAVYNTGQFVKDTLVVYRDPPADDIRLRIASVTLDGGAAGTGGIVVACRSEGAWHLKNRQGPLVMPNVSPSTFVQREAEAVGLRAVVQPSPTRAQIARDVPAEGDSSRGASRPSSWTTFQRLASELGYYVFEFGGTIYFGKPSWLIAPAQSGEAPLVMLPHAGVDERFAALTMPSIAMSEDAEVPVELSGIELHKSRFSQFRPGRALQLSGVPHLAGRYLITQVSMPLLGVGNLSVSASTPVDPPPQPPQPPASQSDGGFADVSSSGGATQAGTKSAPDFVTVALSQQGKRYVFGAEANPSTNSPGAFDCSELIEWALGRVGITFVDGSANQIGRCKAISVAQGIKTRGALLYKPGHIGISLGDGRTMEARNSRVGVGVFRAADIAWTRAGLVPGLRYA